MRKVKIICIAFLLLIYGKSFSTVHVINQSGYTFSPSSLNVNVGDVVRWVWSGGSHTTTSKTIPVGAQAWDSPLNSSVTSFDYTVTVEGTYNYVCTPHEGMGMVGIFTASPVTSVSENSLLKDFSIYPNPASTFINISSKINGDVVVCDLLGRNLKELNLNNSYPNEGLYRIDLSDLPDGVYIVTLNSASSKKRLSLKFVKG